MMAVASLPPTSWLSSAMHPYDEPYIFRVGHLFSTQPRSADYCGSVHNELVVSSSSQLSDSDRLNALVHELQQVRWLPDTFIALVVQHQLDVEGILELTDANLRKQFFIDDASVRNRVRSYFSLCLRIFETQQDDELQYSTH